METPDAYLWLPISVMTSKSSNTVNTNFWTFIYEIRTCIYKMYCNENTKVLVTSNNWYWELYYDPIKKIINYFDHFELLISYA